MNTQTTQTVQLDLAASPKTNEHGSVSVQGHIKIFDPETKEVLINTRA